jgi:long-chain fatty acid transport protein
MMLYTLNLNPSIAYQINNWLAVGGGVAIEYANFYQTVALPVSKSPPFDGQATLKLDNTSPGVNLGVLFTPSPNSKIGVAFRSQIIHHLRGSTDFANISTTPSTTSRMTMPANIIASIAQNVTPKITLLGEAGWANWSSTKDLVVTIAGYTADTPQNWHDTYRLGLGGQYKFTSDFLLQAGASYDSSPTSSSKRLPILPMDRQIRVGFGMEYAMVRAAVLGLSYEYINLGNASINNTTSNGVMSGSYSRNYANVFQASVNVGC